MAEAQFQEVIAVDYDKLFQAITKYEDYPQFVSGCSGVKVERKGPGQARVAYDINMIKDISYTLDHKEDREKGTLEWSLVASDFIKKNNGAWKIKKLAGGKCDVNYSIEIEFKIPVPGMILNRLVKSSLPAMVKGFVKRAEAL